MKKINTIKITVLSLILAACGASGLNELDAKKAQLEELRKEAMELDAQIATLEGEILSQDPQYNENRNKVLISTLALQKMPFVHKVEVRGSVASRKNVLISAETMGRVESVMVTEGQNVKKGQLLIKLDADILENNISEVETNLELAKVVFERQASLWEKNIGTEIQYLQAKTNKESYEKRLATLKAQLEQAYVKAPFSGVIDDVPVKIGEMAQPGLPLVRIVNPREMYIKADASEAFLGKFNKDDIAEIYFPIQDIRMKSKIESVGKVINSENRTFVVEVSIPQNSKFEFRPNQVVLLELVDYQNESGLSVPTKLVQSDDKGTFVYQLSSEEGKQIARKVRVSPGMTYNSQTEILAGLTEELTLIDKGYRDVNEGVEVTLSE